MDAEERGNIEGLMRQAGLEEKEAHIAYHLERARKLFEELEDPGWDQMEFAGHIGGLYNMLARRVLARDYPEGWGPTAGSEEGEQPH